jgi:4-hydroxythreonine-4-phosphate dehydrogenase
MGDPSGIGPEIVAKSLLLDSITSSPHRFVVIGSVKVMEETVGLFDIPLKVQAVESPEQAGTSRDTIYVYSVGESFSRSDNPFGEVTYDCGVLSLTAVRKAADLITRGEIDSCATAPVSKEAFHLAGAEGAGHAEIFAKAAGADSIATMLCHGSFRVVHLTTHLSLADACKAVKKDRIIDVARLTNDSLKQISIAAPKIAAAALNPHGGDGGLFGREELDEIEPAVHSLRDEGMDIEGPIPADIVFSQARGGLFDAVIAMYHDQGHIPIKVASFEYDKQAQKWTSTGGVTLTLGLPFVRTSVDHGTAFDIAGTGKGDEGAMAGAIELAMELS